MIDGAAFDGVMLLNLTGTSDQQRRDAALTVAEHCPEPTERLAALQALGLAEYQAAPPSDLLHRGPAREKRS